MKNVEFWKEVRGFLNGMEQRELTAQQADVISQCQKELDRFFNWSMTDDEVDQSQSE